MIELRDLGSFFVGGRKVVVSGGPIEPVALSTDARYDYDPNGTYWMDCAYVQYFLPAKARFSTPLLLVHGGGCTGAVWENTPDGRTGWLTHLLEAGLAVYVIDNVERGRAGFCPFDAEWPEKPIIRSEEEAWSMYRFGRIEDGRRVAFPGQQFPTEAISMLSAQTVPRWPGNNALQLAALVSAIRKVGPLVLVGHSQGGGLSFHAADQARDLVRALVLLEPHGLPMVFAPEISGIPAYLVIGDYIEEHDYWAGLRVKYGRSLDAWRAAGGKAEICDLPAMGIRGNSHMLMMDRNSEKVLDVIVRWLVQQHTSGAFD